MTDLSVESVKSILLIPIASGKLRWSETDKFENFDFNNFSPCHLMTKFCTLIHLQNMEIEN